MDKERGAGRSSIHPGPLPWRRMCISLGSCESQEDVKRGEEVLEASRLGPKRTSQEQDYRGPTIFSRCTSKSIIGVGHSTDGPVSRYLVELNGPISAPNEA